MLLGCTKWFYDTGEVVGKSSRGMTVIEMSKKLLKFYQATFAYIAIVVLNNTLFLIIPFVTVWGITVTPADIFAGSIYVFRDFAQREIRHFIFVAMLIASAISFMLTSKAIALASLSAFAVAETIDWGVFTFTRKPLSERLISSAMLSSPVDSFVFIYVANTLHTADFILMTLAKFLGVLLIWAIWKYRQSGRAEACLTQIG